MVNGSTSTATILADKAGLFLNLRQAKIIAPVVFSARLSLPGQDPWL